MTSIYKRQDPNGRYDPRTTFTTLEGKDIHFIPFSWDEYQLALAGLKEEYRERGDPIDCPQYEIKLATGVVEKIDHDEKSILEVPPGTPEEDKALVIEEQQALWVRYQETLQKFTAEDGEIMASYVYDESLAELQLPTDTAWEERQRKRHIKIPEDPHEKRLHYINTVVLKSKADQLDLLSTIAAVSMGIVKEADIERVRSSFRDRLFGGLTQLLGNAPGQTEIPEDGKVAGK
jgi:hypothetical protein